MESNSKKEQIIRDYIDAYNRFDIPAMLVNLHDDVVFINMAKGNENLKVNGKDRFKTQAETAATLFSEREQIIKNITFDTDVTATVSIAYKGTIAADIPDFQLKKGDSIVLSGLSVFVFDDNTIVQITDISN